MNKPTTLQQGWNVVSGTKVYGSMLIKLRQASVWAIVVLWTVACCAAPAAWGDEFPLELVPKHTNQVEFQVLSDGEYRVETLGTDPYIEFILPPVPDSAEMPILGFEYFTADGIQSLEIRLRPLRGGWEGPIDAGSLTKAEGWTNGTLPLVEQGRQLWSSGNADILRIDFGMEAGKSLRLRGVKVRSYTQQELRLLETAALRRATQQETVERWENYLSPNHFPSTLSVVIGSENNVIVRGTVGAGLQIDGIDKLGLTELLPHEVSVVEASRPIVATLDSTHFQTSNGSFEIQLPRFVAGYDRLQSRWQLVRAGPKNADNSVLSAAHYVTELKNPADNRLPPVPNLRNAKGLGGVSPIFGLEELSELGIRHITSNVVITNLIEDHEIPNAESFEFGGTRWWVRPGRLDHVDQATRFATEHGITVAAIILLPQKARDILIHPDSRSSGIYAMPNLTNATAAQKYAAVLHLLASRYAGGTNGRIDHWIMHNEVDFGWIWTNMGEQPMAVFMDHYVRSMRLAHQHASQFNPHAKVFISLTHHWNVPEDPRWRTYPPRAMLDHLAKLIRVEGDFEWGVAYHPYPENLFEPKTWLDTQTEDNFDTRLITMKNLDVLKRFLQQDRFRNSQGQLRDVLLSEQGYHTNDYETEAQRLQAAALLYTWEQLRKTDFVLAYDYHRWVDAAEEGGLLLGLRTVGTPQNPAGDKKLGWSVFRDIGTEEEGRWREQLEILYKNQP